MHALLAGTLGFILTMASVNLACSNEPKAIHIAEGASILYYNHPAAVEYNDKIAIGYVTSDGLVEVALVDPTTKVKRKIRVHDYGSPDDHAAPALYARPSGLLVATSHHSSDLFLYRIGNEGTVEQVCKWEGKFSYPRFELTKGRLNLYIRYEDNDAGHLAKIDAPEDCAAPLIIHYAEKHDWIYATAPNKGSFAWSIYNSDTKRHRNAYIDGRVVKLSPTQYQESLAWSVARKYVSVTRFSHAFACCEVGEMRAEIYAKGRLRFTSTVFPAPFYPTGIVLAKDASEALIPKSSRIFDRRSLGDLSARPSCHLPQAVNARAQYVEGHAGSYVWMVEQPPVGQREFQNSTIMLCWVGP